MRYIAQAVAFAALAGVTAWLEVSGKDTGILWFIVIMWVFFGDWTPSKEEKE